MSNDPTTDNTPDADSPDAGTGISDRITAQAVWLSDQIDDDERAVADVLRMKSTSDELPDAGRAIHRQILDADSPGEAITARVSECASKRGIIAWVLEQASKDPDSAGTVGVVLDWLTLPYADKEGFQDEWRPRWLGLSAPPSVQSPVFEQIPRPVFRAMEVGVRLVSVPKDIPGFSWGDVEPIVLLFWRNGDDDITAGSQQLPVGRIGAANGVEVLRSAADFLREVIVHPVGLPFYGLGMICERLHFDGGVDKSEFPQGTPEEFAAACEQLVHSGRARRAMVVAAAFTDGWRYECVWPQTGGDQQVTVLTPGEDWPDPHDLAVAVTETVAKLKPQPA